MLSKLYSLLHKPKEMDFMPMKHLGFFNFPVIPSKGGIPSFLKNNVGHYLD